MFSKINIIAKNLTKTDCSWQENKPFRKKACRKFETCSEDKCINGIWVTNTYTIHINNIKHAIYTYYYQLVYPMDINIFPIGCIPCWLYRPQPRGNSGGSRAQQGQQGQQSSTSSTASTQAWHSKPHLLTLHMHICLLVYVLYIYII